MGGAKRVPQVEEVVALFEADIEEVGEPRGDEHAGARAAAFDDGVGDEGGARPTISTTSESGMLWRASISAVPSSTAAEGSSGVVSCLWMSIPSRAGPVSAKSVKVPPMSTPSLYMG